MRISRLWILPCLLAVVAAVVVIWATVMMGRWLTGEGFHALLEREAGRALQIKAELGPLSLEWLGVTSPKFRGTGSEKTPLKKLDTEGLHAKLRLTSPASGFWAVEEVSMDKLKLHLGPANSVKENSRTNAAALVEDNPSPVVIDVLRSRESDVLIELPDGKSVNIIGTTMEARPQGDQMNCVARGGTLRSCLFPDLVLNLKSAAFHFSNGDATLSAAELTPVSGGMVHLEGFFPNGKEESHIKGHCENIPTSALLPHYKEIRGTLDGWGIVKWTPGHSRGGEGFLRGNNIILENMPALEKLADLTGIDEFRHLAVQEFEVSFEGDPSATRWKNLILEAKGYIRLTGEATTTSEGALAGNFQLGITGNIINMIPMAPQILGLREHDGYLWMPVTIGGTLDHPSEDLTVRLGLVVAAGAEGLLRKGVRQGLDILGITTGETEEKASKK